MIRVSDGAEAATHVMTLQVVDPDQRPPEATLRVPGFVFVGDAFVAQVEATDPNPGDVLSYAFVDAAGRAFTRFDGPDGPAGMSIEPTTGRVAWNPVDGQQSPDGAPYRFTVRVSDGRFAVNLGPASVEVIDRPTAAQNPPRFVRAAAERLRGAGGRRSPWSSTSSTSTPAAPRSLSYSVVPRRRQRHLRLEQRLGRLVGPAQPEPRDARLRRPPPLPARSNCS